MQHLTLSPLPSADAGENPHGMANAQPGFVDDDVVLTLLAGVVGSRTLQNPGLLALAADQMDYAGWPPSVATDKRFARLS